MLAGLQRIVDRDGWRNRRAADHLAVRRRHLEAPYPVRLYGRFLDSVVDRRAARIAVFDAPPPGQWERGIVIVRHDVDTAGCVERLHLLLDADLSRNVSAATFLRTDGIDYDPSTVAETVRRYRNQPGLTFGLHTSCYLHDDFLGALGREIQRFGNVFGFAPDTFTVHGLGRTRADVRRRFVETMRTDLRKVGFSFTDCHPDFRRYDYVVEDCHLDAGSGARFVYDDIVAGPGWVARGETYLLLTHPCYWRDGE